VGGQQVGLLVISLDVTASVLAIRRTLLGFLAAFVVSPGPWCCSCTASCSAPSGKLQAR
jgi:hypothetical protein